MKTRSLTLEAAQKAIAATEKAEELTEKARLCFDDAETKKRLLAEAAVFSTIAAKEAAYYANRATDDSATVTRELGYLVVNA